MSLQVGGSSEARSWRQASSCKFLQGGNRTGTDRSPRPQGGDDENPTQEYLLAVRAPAKRPFGVVLEMRSRQNRGRVASRAARIRY